jgi:hypothetical protein
MSNIDKALQLVAEKKQREHCIANRVCPDCAVNLEYEKPKERSFLGFKWMAEPSINLDSPFEFMDCPSCKAVYII